MTTRQTELLVDELLHCETSAISQRLSNWADGKTNIASSSATPRKARNEADWIARDVNMLRNVGARLEARLLSTPLESYCEGTADILLRGLRSLLPVLGALTQTVQKGIADLNRFERPNDCGTTATRGGAA